VDHAGFSRDPAGLAQLWRGAKTATFAGGGGGIRKMQQAGDFGEESAALDALLRGLRPCDWQRPTQFKGWTPEDIVIHLHFWNLAQDRALAEPAAFRADVAAIRGAVAAGRGRLHEARVVHERGQTLRAAWAAYAAEMARRWAEVDPKLRVSWVGPEMSARSAMTARQMETWAHGLAIWDMMGRARPEHDRLRNIVHLGVTAFPWSFHVQGLESPPHLPRLELVAPSGTLWTYGEAGCPDRIAGPAADFCKVVTQTRNVADTALQVEGPVARAWMTHAQCFAGPRETPPRPGARFRQNEPPKSSDDFG
jgi:uncharacterized protein (TIGR03084 family)